MKKPFRLIAALAVLATLGATSAHAGVAFSQGFETDTSGWFDGSSGWLGSITRVASGTGGVASAEGAHHAIAEEADDSSVFTRFDGYRSDWTGTWTASVDVYLDTSWAAGSGFDYAVASSNSSGGHLRDYIFHVTKDTSTGDLLVSGSNNTNFAPREDLETLNHYAVSTSGWYTLQHVFYDLGGQLAVDLNLLSSVGSVLFTETRTAPADLIASVVGGNRYGWFTDVTVANGLAIDDVSLTVSDVPEPGSLALAALALTGLGVASRRRRRG